MPDEGFPLKLGGLQILINSTIDSNPRAKERIVCIPNNKGGMGGTSVTNAVHAGGGIDWDVGKFFIWPENKMIEYGIEPISNWEDQARQYAQSKMPDKWDMEDVHLVYEYFHHALQFISNIYNVYTK